MFCGRFFQTEHLFEVKIAHSAKEAEFENQLKVVQQSRDEKSAELARSQETFDKVCHLISNNLVNKLFCV